MFSFRFRRPDEPLRRGLRLRISGRSVSVDCGGELTYETIRIDDLGRGERASTAMRTVFQDGEIYDTANDTLDVIRRRAGVEFE